MSYIFEHSCLAAKPELDLFSNQATQASIEEGFHTEHMPTTSLTDSGPIKFSVSGDSNYYLDLNSSYILMEVKITKDNGNNIDDIANVGPVNLLGHSLFQQIDVSLNDVVISNASNLYHYRAILETMLSYNQEAKGSQLSMSLYSKDTPGQMNNIENGNTGLVSRRSVTGVSRTVQLIIKPHADIFFQKRFILNGVDLKLKLVRNDDRLVLMAAENSNFKLKIKSASFFVRKVKINSGIQLKHIEKLDKLMQPAIYPLRRVDMKTFNIATGSLSWNEENLFHGILPKRVVVGIVNSRAFEGAYELNPFDFVHKNLKYCNLMVDGKSSPQKPLISDFANHNTLRNYFMLLESTGKVFNNGGIDINRTDYEQGYSILAFDLTPDLDESGCYHILKKGNIRLELKFDQALDQPINVIVYSEFDSAVKIDKNRAVLTNFFAQ